MSMRKRLYEIVEVSRDNDKVSTFYDFFMLICILCSLIPLCFKETNNLFKAIDTFTVCVFIADYIFRLSTADYKLKKGLSSFIRYPFTFMAIIDILSILPSLTTVSQGLKILRVLRIGKTLKVLKVFKTFKAFKAFRYSKNIDIIISVFRKQKDSLVVVCFLAFGYVLVTALVIFNVEPDTFGNFFDAIYWATISLTTVGYGDIYASSVVGRIITMISSIFGIAIVALPAGIITAGYMDEISKKQKMKKEVTKNE